METQEHQSNRTTEQQKAAQQNYLNYGLGTTDDGLNQ
jgi:hypothetical protein